MANAVFVMPGVFANNGTTISPILSLALLNGLSLQFGSGSTADVFAYGSASKTLRLDTDGLGGALTLVDVKGPLTASGNITSASDIVFSSTGFLRWNNSTVSKFRSATDGIFQFFNSAGSAGAAADVTTDGTLWVKTTGAADTAILKANVLNPTGSAQINGALLVSATAPTVSAGFGSGSAGTVTFNTGTLAVVVTVGTNAGGTTGTITFPSAPHGWAVVLQDTTNTADLTRQTGYTQTTATFSTTVAWTTGDVLVGIAVPF